MTAMQRPAGGLAVACDDARADARAKARPRRLLAPLWASKNLALTSCGVLVAAIGMVDQAGRRLLPLDGHGQGCDGQ